MNKLAIVFAAIILIIYANIGNRTDADELYILSDYSSLSQTDIKQAKEVSIDTLDKNYFIIRCEKDKQRIRFEDTVINVTELIHLHSHLRFYKEKINPKKILLLNDHDVSYEVIQSVSSILKEHGYIQILMVTL